MTPDDARLRRKEVELGMEATRIMESPLWISAYEKLARELNESMLSTASDDEETLECKRELLALHKVKKHLETAIVTGQMASNQLENASGKH